VACTPSVTPAHGTDGDALSIVAVREKWFDDGGQPRPRRPTSETRSRPTASVAIGERPLPVVIDERGDQGGLDVMRDLSKCQLPRYKQLIRIGEVPDVATAAVAVALSCALLPILVKALRKAAIGVLTDIGLTDVDDGRARHPGTLKLAQGDRRVLPGQPPRGAAFAELGRGGARAQHDIDPSDVRDIGSREIGEAHEAGEGFSFEPLVGEHHPMLSARADSSHGVRADL
jgi:hypothetical protein